jgi:hypothetical protein
MTMRKKYDAVWTENLDLDLMRATRRGVLGGWIVVGAIAALMLIVPPAVTRADMALAHARQNIEKVEHRAAQAFGWSHGARLQRC